MAKRNRAAAVCPVFSPLSVTSWSLKTISANRKNPPDEISLYAISLLSGKLIEKNILEGFN
ncbi:hypothetical protein AS29_012795 [Bacillus sp. SJS]|nr:hypothetical protein AS29_012795 [Bacillus sp. SJS]